MGKRHDKPAGPFGPGKAEQDPQDLGLAGNELLEEAVSEFYERRTRRKLSALLKTIQQQADLGAHVLVPVETQAGPSADVPAGQVYTFQKGMDCQLRTIQSTDEKMWLSAFTSVEEVKRGQETTVLSYPLLDLMRLAMGTDNVNGIVLNPWGKSYSFVRELIRVVLTALEEEHKGKR